MSVVKRNTQWYRYPEVSSMMSSSIYDIVPEAALRGSMRDFRVPKGSNLLDRVGGFYEWQNIRRRNGVWPFSRSTQSGPAAVCLARDDSGSTMTGVNFASQDYLSLSAHPEIKATASSTIEKFGVHSAGSPALVGNTRDSIALERKIADFLEMPEAVLFPTGWAAGYGVIRGLVRSPDHIVIDALAHVCLQEGANAETRNIYTHRQLDLDHCRHWLQKIRAKDAENGIMVVTEGLFSMDSDTPDIAALQDLCHEYGATLLIDVAHDLGPLGEDGRGHIGIQKMLGKVDLVMGSFSKTFASNGGFVACRNRAVKEYLRFYSPSATFSNALSQAQAANVLNLRATLSENGMGFYGDPSAIVCVKVGTERVARLVSRQLPDLGLLANLVEYPAVSKGAARFRMQVMAKHSPQNIADAVARLRRAFDEASREQAAGEPVQFAAVA